MSADSQASDPVGNLTEEAAKLLRALTSAGERDAGAARGGRAHDPSTCAYCPICQLIGLVRDTSPETLEHLAASLTSFTAAVRSLVDSVASHSQSSGNARDGGVQTIDLSDDTWPDADGSGQDRAAQDRAAQDRAAQDRAGEHSWD